jgi:hypothetical protein
MNKLQLLLGATAVLLTTQTAWADPDKNDRNRYRGDDARDYDDNPGQKARKEARKEAKQRREDRGDNGNHYGQLKNNGGYDQNGRPLVYDRDGRPVGVQQGGQVVYDRNGRPVNVQQAGQVVYDRNGRPVGTTAGQVPFDPNRAAIEALVGAINK